ncbi:hypothetical protein GF376_04730 [Candidatus Peregrinibacteria bacterium]|nr:hypothetical protein [Candidatus Peregrinibacteria bacterium]
MNWFNFIRLIWMIYGPGKVNLNLIQKMGLLAVKIGQVHALRLDFLPLEKCQKLSELYRATIPIESEQVLSKIDHSHFKNIKEKPLASASIGQVHLATLKSGERVVIKVVKNKFKKQFKKDVKSVKKFVNLAIKIYPKLRSVFDPIGILEHIEQYTLQELNLKNEIKGHNRLQKIYQENKDKYDLSKLAFPKIYEEISSEDILVMEHVDGKTFDEILETELDYQELLDLFHIHGFFIFNIGTFHGDLHPGNLIHYNGKIYFVDTGAIGEVSEKISKGLFKFFDYLSQYDYKNAAYWLNQMAEKQIKGKDFDNFQLEFIKLYQDFDNTTVSEISLTKKMMQTIKLGVLKGMDFEKGMFSIIKSLMFLDGMVIRNNPHAILLKDMRQFIDELNNFKTN